MTGWASRLATLLGGTGFLGGIVVLAMAIPRRGTLGWALVLGPDVPGWAFVTSFLGGPMLLLAGAIFGMRYGNFERFHRDYDEETGTIDSDHPVAALHRKVTIDRLEPDNPPEKFVFARAHLAATIAVVALPLLGYLYVSGIDGWLLWVMGTTLVGGGLLAFLVTDYVLRNGDEHEYGA